MVSYPHCITNAHHNVILLNSRGLQSYCWVFSHYIPDVVGVISPLYPCVAGEIPQMSKTVISPSHHHYAPKIAIVLSASDIPLHPMHSNAISPLPPYIVCVSTIIISCSLYFYIFLLYPHTVLHFPKTVPYH